MKDIEIIDFDGPGGRGGMTVKKVILIIVAILVVMYIAISLYFTKHFLPNTTVNGASASFKTVKTVSEELSDKVADYTLTIEEQDGETEEIKGSDIDLMAVNGESVADNSEFETKTESVLKQQNGFLWIINSWHKKTLNADLTVTYDESKLKDQISKLSCLSDSATKTQNASISDTQTNGKFTIVPAVYGTAVKKKVLTAAVTKTVESLNDTLNLEESGCYELPTYTKDSAETKAALKTVNKMTSMKITYDMLDIDDVVCDAETIRSWLTIDDEMNVSVSKKKVAAFVREFAKKYNTAYTDRKFKTADGEVITTNGGYYGWRLDESKETAKLVSEVKAGKDVDREPEWYRTAVSHKAKDYGNTYAEVDISEQRMWYFEDGKKKMSSAVVTGNVSLGNGTPQGIFYIMYKEKDATLTGEDYSSPVTYWMPFETNVGFHDATWRSKFGGQIYKTNGSHGCVNMPPKAAKKLFSLIKKGCPVIVHK